MRNHLSHARKLNIKNIRKIETYIDEIFNFSPTEFTKEDLTILDQKKQDLAEVYLSKW
ncbi:MAG: hypothetical protein ACFFCI_20495 [Promethearchaeota archaeon]